MISPKIEESRIVFALRGCRDKGFEVYEAKELIKKAVDEFGDSLAVACSFGRCSVAVLHMTRDLNPHIKVVFQNTGVQYSETYAYRDLLVKEWNLNFIETKPTQSFWQCLDEYGFPLESRTAKGSPGKPKCCTYLKEKPFQDATKKFGIEAVLTGLRATESRARMFAISQFGQYYLMHSREKIWKYHPIAFWKTEEVISYLNQVQIPLNKAYANHGLERTGCMPCTAYKGWEKVLAGSNPKLYRHIQKLRGVSLIDGFLSLEESAFNGCNQASPTKRQSIIERWF